MLDVEIVDLFAGPGGLDVAATWLGLPVVGIEWDANACATRSAAGLHTKQGDVRNFGPEDFPLANVLTAGPPCQTYTVAGTGTGRRALEDVLGFAKRMADRDRGVAKDMTTLPDERTALVLEPLRWALQAKDSGHPYDAIVLEQVPAVLPVWAAMHEILEAEDYSVAHGVLRTEQYGVPQTRRRAILIARRTQGAALRREGSMALPKPEYRQYRRGVPRSQGDDGLRPWVTMHNALDRTAHFVVVSNYGTGGDPKARGRRTSDEPSATVTGKISRNRLITPRGDELPRFTAAEAGQLQTFPVDYPWSGSDIAQQIGNAIPPLLAAHVLVAALDLDTKLLTELRVPDLPRWAATTVPEPRALTKAAVDSIKCTFGQHHDVEELSKTMDPAPVM
ncbi:DNA cytosine methyltransferase [Microtetraspora malaysiensis]|uniref:DNA cytosine methyltransferase n=1 Tax=Microtetraspora malaysiensis TaxID=161358 RepID=UPI003D8F5C18